MTVKRMVMIVSLSALALGLGGLFLRGGNPERSAVAGSDRCEGLACEGDVPVERVAPVEIEPVASEQNPSSEVMASLPMGDHVAPAVYIDLNQLAVRGTDPVAYFTAQQPILGLPQFEYEWQGATWRFSSAETRDRFIANPMAYAPQYGGYCAQAVSNGYLASIDPNAWEIVDGKLYLNYSLGVQRQWRQDIPGNIARADANWPEVLIDNEVHH
jgi:YHS domain-containing protein